MAASRRSVVGADDASAIPLAVPSAIVSDDTFIMSPRLSIFIFISASIWSWSSFVMVRPMFDVMLFVACITDSAMPLVFPAKRDAIMLLMRSGFSPMKANAFSIPNSLTSMKPSTGPLQTTHVDPTGIALA